MRATCFGGAQQAAHVGRVLYLIEQQQQRRLPGRMGTRKRFVKFGVGVRANFQHYTLMVLTVSDRIQFFRQALIYFDLAPLGFSQHITQRVTVSIAGDDQSLEVAAPRTERFEDDVAPVEKLSQR